jgi:hypothetical protein
MIIFKLTSRFDSFLWTFDDPAPLYLNLAPPLSIQICRRKRKVAAAEEK